jgi:transposase
VRQTQYQYVYVVGAAWALTGQAEAIIVPYLNTDVINLFLEQFSAALEQGVHAILVWDGAGYHRSGKLKIPENITVVPLPPYSPELNPIENLWHFLKSHYWANRVYDDYDVLFQAAMEAWRCVCLNPDNIQSICTTPYAQCDVIQ